MQDKRLGKVKLLSEELEGYQTIGVYGDKNSSTAILCWGSTKPVCCEAAQNLGLKVIQPRVLSPFSVQQFKMALGGVKRLISVENNATGQLVRLIKYYGFDVDKTVLKYDGRPFAVDELQDTLSPLGRGQG
jgi:2-oxoglutarate ferredoxin oxidoreductase subunit alpha